MHTTFSDASPWSAWRPDLMGGRQGEAMMAQEWLPDRAREGLSPARQGQSPEAILAGGEGHTCNPTQGTG